MSEKWIEEARKTAELVEPPESLSPDSVREKLMREGRKPKNQTGNLRRYLAQAAAVLFLFLILGGGSIWIFRQVGQSGGKGSSPAETYAGSLNEGAAEKTAEVPEEGKTLPGSYRAAGSYEEIYTYLKDQEWYYEEMKEETWAETEAGAIPEMAPDGATSETEAAVSDGTVSDTSAGADDGYSKTNTQVEGVDEADIVKTDGTYLYVVSDSGRSAGRVHIIKAEGGTLTELSVTEPVTDGVYQDYDSVLELYVDGDVMVLLMDCIDEDTADSYTVTAVYDITDRRAPRVMGLLTQDGIYSSSRKNGDYVYVFTRKGAWAEEDRRCYIPYADGEPIPCSSLYYSPETQGAEMLVVTALNIRKPEQFTDRECIYYNGDTMYVSEDAIYVAGQYWGNGQTRSQTELFKVSYKDGRLEASASKRFLGWLNNQFSMDQYKDCLRLVATVDDYRRGGRSNALYVMDEQLEIVGSIQNLAPDERIYSARFMGDTGYFVTFRETDPLFSVDLSDPTDPKIMGELKITGFSSYLHGYSDELLLGIGREINPRTGADEGIKLSMFDISDPYNVKEQDKQVLEEYWDSPALSNHKAVLIDTEKNLFGFAVCGYRKEMKEDIWEYLVYSYDEKWGFTERLSISLASEKNGEGWLYENFWNTRGLYIGDILYLTGFNSQIRAYSMKTGEELGCLTLTE